MTKDEDKYVTPSQYRVAHAIWDDANAHHQRTVIALRNAEEEEANAKEGKFDANQRMRDASAGLSRWIVDGHGGDE